ncbi:MAG: ATPase, P-type (Transporting), HAD superfamily, subfamily IC [Candidatus Woesebacteria bacterium GW2011_GWB1_44_11b]|uniref:ATPase, P-type (Transporting), HAD superfamily, subfamily IC n=1 Tax=Candidatus Woesebacteria bacterium GW2011_GWB1_44_11b TaxID=1618580 RepID=A0A0G1GFN7_9BACT|nr:MAG: ATPase, P-type (Transporting), HAD superfamily, subfamily IC [Candidatus Woesebacteria bacterium GW2011_GWB1_44_11b]
MDMNTLTTPWHSFSLKKIYQELETSENGLSIEEARNRLKRYGENSLPKEKTPTVLQIFLNQFRNPLIYILLAA